MIPSSTRRRIEGGKKRGIDFKNLFREARKRFFILWGSIIIVADKKRTGESEQYWRYGMQSIQTVDQSALKFNQLSIVTFTVLGFIIDEPIIPAIVAAILIAGSINKRLALFKMTYRYILKPLKLLRPRPVAESPAPHEFAQLLGGIFLGIGSILLFGRMEVPGWGLAWLVILLAFMNLVFGFCAGCFVYFQLAKLGMPGFIPQNRDRVTS